MRARAAALVEKRAVGVIRVSESGDREGDSFISPVEQRQQLTTYASRAGLALVTLFDEIDVSAGLPLSKRKGLRPAVEMIERGEADILLFAYFDRSFRNLGVQMEALARVEQAGGTTYACDYGEIRTDTAARWLSTMLLGVVNEYGRRTTSEKVMRAKADAVARGVPPFARIVRGYRRGPDGRIVVEPREAPLIADVFRMRANGATLQQCRDWLAEHGITLSYSSTKALFASKLVLGELHAGKLVNPHSHTAIVDRQTWLRVQQVKVPRGRPPLREDSLLARLALLRCSGCGHAMSASSTQLEGRRYRFYQCGRKPDCSRPVAVSADLVEGAVAQQCQKWIADRAQTATVGANVAEAEAECARREALLDAAVAAFDGTDVASTRERLRQLQAELAEALETLNRLSAAASASERVSGSDWGRLTWDERRQLLRAIFKSITVAPATRSGARSIDSVRARLAFEPFAE